MKAICVTPERSLELRDIPAPGQAAPGHALIAMEASAINHGDKAFLRMPASAASALALSQHDVWGVSGAGTVLAIGAGVPAHYAGRRVAVYRSLNRSADNLGLWSETAQVPYASCLILPEHANVRDYSGSLVNVITAHAFLETIAETGHRGVIVTAGNSATGRAIAALARRAGLPSILLVRSHAARESLQGEGFERVLVTDEGLADELGKLSAELNATAVFDGVGGELAGRIVPCLPMHSSVYFYGSMAGSAPLSVSAPLFLQKGLSMQRFSNFESRTVREPGRLLAALSTLEELIGDPLFQTRVGKVFTFDRIHEAMVYESADGGRPVLIR